MGELPKNWLARRFADAEKAVSQMPEEEKRFYRILLDHPDHSDKD